MPLLEVEKLTIRFGGLVAVKDVDLAIQEKQIFALIGPNGAGKTTVFNAISGIYDPTSGQLRFRGEPLQLPLSARVGIMATIVGIVTALGMYLLALNPDQLWKATIRRPNNEALWLGTPFRFSEAFSQAGRYVQGGLTLEYSPRLVRVPLEPEQTELGDPKATYNVPAYEIISADGAFAIRPPVSDDSLEPLLAGATRKYERLRRDRQADPAAVADAKRERQEVLLKMAQDSRAMAKVALDALQPAESVAVSGSGERWQLVTDAPVAHLTFPTEQAASEAVKQLETLREGLPARRWYHLLAPLTGLLLGAAGYLAVWSRSRRTPDVIARRGIARTFQNIRLFHNMTVVENVLVGMDRHFMTSLPAMAVRSPGMFGEEQQRCSHAVELLKFVGLADRRDMLAKNLPYGDQRRLEIARALASDPQLLMLDEPAAGMNPAESADLMKLIRAIRDRGMTVLLIEHHMRLVMGISDRIAVLEYGEKIAEGTPEEVRKNPRVIEAYLGKEEVH